MLRNIKRFFGADEVQAALASNEAIPLVRPTRSASTDAHCPVTSSVLGQSLIVTLVDSDLNAFKAAEINHEIRLLLEANPGARNLVLDMENIKFLDSAGLNTLVDLISPVRQR